jgi:adenylate cyclase
MPMLVRVGDTLYPSLSADMLRLAQGASTYVVKSSGASGEKAFGEKTGIVAVKVGDSRCRPKPRPDVDPVTPESKERYLPAGKF